MIFLAKNKIEIYRGIRNVLLGYDITSVLSNDKGVPVVDYRDSNGKGTTRKSKMSLIRTRGKRKTSTDYKKIT